MDKPLHILFLSHYFPPEVNAPASRTYEHCREWVRNGHRVTVVTCAPNHPRGKVYDGYRNGLWEREERDGIDVWRVWTYVTANEGFLKRTLNYLSYMAASIVIAPFLPKVDVVISTSPQFFNGLAGYVVSRQKRAPWVLEIRDLWPESILAVGAISNRTIIRALEWLELLAYRKADRIVPVTNAFQRHMERKGIAASKITVLKNGADLSLYKPVAGQNPLIQELGLNGKFIAAYFGTHGMAHQLETILHAAERLRRYRDIVFLLAGDGAERERLLSLRDQLALTNVVMLEQQPKERMPWLWALCHVSLILLKKSELFKTVIPSKLFESMAMEKPIILGVEGESAEILQAAKAGFCIEPENDEELAARMLELWSNRALCQTYGLNGRRHVLENYDRSQLAKRYQQLLQSLS
ncbi:MAG: glycosyltransferase family 4 protein [Nitrospirales bacterium]|nr:glycosyltransferase family 4 protein [Nitrospirales bacterium]